MATPKKVKFLRRQNLRRADRKSAEHCQIRIDGSNSFDIQAVMGLHV